MWKHYLCDAKGTDVKVNEDSGEDTGLVVATRPHKTFTSRIAFMTNIAYGRDMAQDGKYGGTLVLIADGDSTPWTFAESATKYTEDSTDRFYAGSKSIKADNADIGEYCEFTNQDPGAGSNIDLDGNYVAFTMWINVDKDWTSAVEVFFQAVVGGSLTGTAVDLSNYFDYLQQDTWHFIAIPLADMGIAAIEIDAVRITQGNDDGNKVKYYVDLLTLEETGSPIAFSVKPTLGTWYYINVFHITMADALAGTVASGTMSGLSYDKFLGLASTEGLKFERYRDDVLVSGSSFQLTNLGDMMSMPNAHITNAIGDGTNTMISVERHPQTPMVLKSEENDELRVTIADDFSQLLLMRFSVMGYVETR